MAADAFAGEYEKLAASCVTLVENMPREIRGGYVVTAELISTVDTEFHSELYARRSRLYADTIEIIGEAKSVFNLHEKSGQEAVMHRPGSLSRDKREADDRNARRLAARRQVEAMSYVSPEVVRDVKDALESWTNPEVKR